MNERMQLTQDGNDRGMMRRTTLFEELHFAMVHSPNPHNYIGGKRYKYRFGVFSKEVRQRADQLRPQLIVVTLVWLRKITKLKFSILFKHAVRIFLWSRCPYPGAH